jgi:anti-sigma regulatory factor (Ser/Thr protein kinase)
VSARFILELPGGADAPARVRQALERELGGDLDADGLYSLRLLASEIVTNSVVHSGLDADGSVTVSVARRRSRVRVELRDSVTRVTPAPREPDRRGGGGFGLHLVDLLAASWGVERGERVCVWFELDRKRDGQFRNTGGGARVRARIARPLHAVALTS